ncbi:MAG TPA: ABC transporter permease [Candidatus Dormibacteraeota bacterium]|nr:ABC transporter permease [Candidatus Dormibacteraeota bacterium]
MGDTAVGGRPARGALPPIRLRLPRSRGVALAIYVGRRVLWMFPVLFFVILITFVLMHLAPGSPWDRTGGRPLSAAVVANMNVKYGLDKPIWQQFLLYIWNALHFDFGLSYQYQGKTVSSLILGGWPYTFTIGLLAFCVIVPVGIGLGVAAALRQNTRADYSAMAFATFGAAVPNFVIGMLLIIVFGVTLYNVTGGNYSLPVSGFGVDDHLIMPVVTLATLPTAYIARLTRASTLDILRQDYVRTAWAKGLSERLVVLKHILKNSLIPVVTALGPTFAILITGSVIVESVFVIPGIGRSFVTAVFSRDYPMILGTTILFAVVIALANLVVDILYVFIDPRVRLS